MFVLLQVKVVAMHPMVMTDVIAQSQWKHMLT